MARTWFDNRKVATKLLVNLAFMVAAILTVAAAGLYLSFEDKIAERKAHIQSAVEIAASSAASLDREMSRQGVSQADKVKALVARLADLSFDGNNHFNIVDGHGNFLLQMSNKSLVGKSALSYGGSNEGLTIADLVASIKQGGAGFFAVNFPKPGATIPSLKINYGQGLPAFDALITTGMYVDDLQAALYHDALLLGCVGIPTLLLAVGYSLLIRASLGPPMAALSTTMRRLAAGDLDATIAGANRRDEFGDMARAVQVFKDQAIHSLKLAQEARQAGDELAATQAAAEAARERSRAEAEAAVDGLAVGLAALAKGNLVSSLKTPFAPDYDQLRTDYNATVGLLKTTVDQIVLNIEAIRSETREITSASDDLSRRTEQQAASLEQTVAALDQLTVTVRATSDGAQTATAVAQTAKSGAEQSGVIVAEAIGAMREIDGSAKKMSQIIGVIDEIAFQTNLLALNAGVEAARAGDAGRGFAVVASEVRALAQRATNAAKEIEALIATSSSQVSRGVDLVDKTGRALERIVAQVGEVHSAIATIAASAQEQANGLHEINAAMNQMDQVTQQNAAMVEQSTAASHNLAAETEQLAHLAAHFETRVETRAA